MHDRPAQPDVIEQYLDGALRGEALADFERRLETDDELRRQVTLGRRIDAALRQRLQSPADDAIGAMLVRARSAGAGPRIHLNGTVNGAAGGAARSARPARRWRRPLAVAAAIALAVAGVWLVVSSAQPGSEPAYGPWRSMQVVYRDTIADGFTPQWVCADEAEFAGHFGKHYGQPLLLRDLPAHVAALGLSYSHTITSQTSCLLVDVGGTPVIVFIDRVERAPMNVDAGAALNVFRRDVGLLALFEVTPREHPAVLDGFLTPTPGERNIGE